MDFIDLKTQYQRYQAEIDARIQAVLQHGQYILGPEIAELETQLAQFTGAKHALTVASGTDSLEIALRALDIGPGDEVITVPFTWISTAEAVALTGATPVFVDIEPASYNIDIDLMEAAITPRTKAILPVSLFGQMPDFERINAIAAKHHLAVIEDAAQSFGATQLSALNPQPSTSSVAASIPSTINHQPSTSTIRRSCGVTLIGSTSFFPAKPLGCYGDGGALFTSDDALADKMRAIRTHGGLKRHHHPYLGMNGRFDSIQAAVLLAKLPHFEWEIRERARIGARYTEMLSSVLGARCSVQASQPSTINHQPSTLLSVPEVMPGNTHVYAQYTIRVSDREALAAALKAEGIPTAVYYPKGLHEQPVFAKLGHRPGSFPVTEQATREVISLPMHPFLAEADQDKIIAAVKSALK